MSGRRKRSPEEQADIQQNLPPLPPARTEEEAEKRACGIAMDKAVELMRNGKASSQIITFFLKLGSQKEQAELRKINKEIEVLESKKQAFESAKDQDKRFQEVMRAMAEYSGKDSEWEVVDDEADYG